MFMKMPPQRSTILKNPFSPKPGLSQLSLIGRVVWSGCFLLFLFNTLSTDTQMPKATST